MSQNRIMKWLTYIPIDLKQTKTNLVFDLSNNLEKEHTNGENTTKKQKLKNLEQEMGGREETKKGTNDRAYL